MLQANKPALILAPMEGVMDPPMRALLAETGGFDFAVSEFLRVSQRPIEAKAIAREVPELRGVRLGRAALPIQVQLLGSDPTLLAATALEACIAGARAIDLNFGCPSPTVVRNRGGSAVLQDPALLGRIVETTRRALPTTVPLSAKVRLGWEKPDEIRDVARAIADGGADWLVIHGRTRPEFYRPGVHWDWIADAARLVKIPVVANGDIFSADDLKKCREMTGCRHFMLGRGALLDPFIAVKLAGILELGPRQGLLQEPTASASPLAGLLVALRRFVEIAEPCAQNSGYVVSRIKQWIGGIRAVAPERIPRPILTAVGRSRTASELLEQLDQPGLTQVRTVIASAAE